MNWVDRLLILILVALSLSVLVTGGLVVYLTLAREGEGTGGVAGEPTVAATAPSEPRIAFVSDRGGDVAIYVMDTDGSNQQRVSGSDQGLYLHPSWSPDGRRVAYVGMEGDPFQRDNPDVKVWVSAADGSEHIHVSHAISNVFGIRPAWSPDGTLLAFVAEGDPAEQDGPACAIHIAQADGSGLEQSIPLPWMAYGLIWSPTGAALLFVSEIPDDESSVQVLFIRGDNRNEDKEITEVFRGTLTADWSPDGEEVVVGDYTSNTIFIVGRDQEPRPIARTTLQPVEVSWSPDGAYIAVSTAGHYRQGYGNILHLVTLETGEVTTVVENGEWVGRPNWSPDSSRLLFTMGPMIERTGADLPYGDLWVYDLTSGGLEQLTIGGGFEGLGVWSP